MLIYLIYDIYVVILNAKEKDGIGMIKSKVLTYCYIIVIIKILRYLCNLPVVQDETAYLAPFSKSIYLISLRINFFPTLHTAVICRIYEAIPQICAVMCQHIRIVSIKKDLLYPVVFVHWIEGHSYLVELPLWQFSTQSVIYYL